MKPGLSDERARYSAEEVNAVLLPSSRAGYPGSFTCLGNATYGRSKEEPSMIVMKFGGSSLASAASISSVVAIIRSEADRHPVVVTSAMGDTTDHLEELLSAAHKANSYAAWKLQEEMKNQHFAACKELLHGEQLSVMNRYLRDTFRDLHVHMLEVCEGERSFNKELQGWTLSLGEQLSSRLLAAILQEHCGDTVHLDARKLILTNSAFLDAQPHYWESCARIRWSVPAAAREKLVVLGGFIGSNEDGHTTTLGRGGSDLTASILGAAINADEIQVWKDVDGMSTCDPRIMPSGLQVKRLTYEEAKELTSAGATILHPDTIAPAQRRHIPIVIRNTFHPAGKGTRIEGHTAEGGGLIKSIAVKSDLTLLEIHAGNLEDGQESLTSVCKHYGSGASVLFSSGEVVYVAVSENPKVPPSQAASVGCVEVRIRSHQAVLTLVGRVAEKDIVAKKLTTALQGIPALLIPSEESTCSVRVAVPQADLRKCMELLHHAFFAHPDPRFFVTQNAVPTAQENLSRDYATPRPTKRPPAFAWSIGMLRMN